MPTIDLTDAEHAAVTALIRRAVEEDRFPQRPAPRPGGSRPADKQNDAADAQRRNQEIAGTPFVEDGSHRG
jgi:hypothetical protein